MRFGFQQPLVEEALRDTLNKGGEYDYSKENCSAFCPLPLNAVQLSRSSSITLEKRIQLGQSRLWKTIES